MNVERGEGGPVEVGGQGNPGQGEEGENQEQGEEGHVGIGGQEDPVEGGQNQEEIPEQRGRNRLEEMFWREAEEDLRFKDDLDTRKSRQEGEVIDTLENLALKCVSNNTDYFITQSEDIHSLPGPVFRLVADRLVKTAHQTELLDILPLVISEKTWELKLRFTPSRKLRDVWTPESMAKVFRLIEEKCKGSLTHLVLSHFCPPHPLQINTILASLENLTTLSIHRGTFGVTDDTLLVLGQNCLKLSYLALDYIEEITDTGVDYLCARAAPYGQCKNLEILNLEGTSVTVDGVVTALSNLPKLKVLGHRKFLIALDKYVKINGVTKKLQLRELWRDRNTAADLENVCKIIPHATIFIVESVGSLRAFFNVNAISKFQLRYSDISLPELNSFITHFSSSLTTFIMMYCDSEIDLSIFGSCPNLEVLELHCCPNISTGQFQLLPSSFMKLKQLTIFPSSVPNITILELDVPYLRQMISSPTLCKLCWRNTTFPEASLYSLIVEAKENQTVFSHLKKFLITQNEYSLDTLKQLICVCPKLSVLHCRMSQESELQLGRFVERNNLPHISI